jgi:phosphoribosylformimino-5-aminoimidazole carboxamide ribotide isomerase
LAQRFERDGAECIVFTDIERDGMLTGANVEATVRLAQAVKIPVIASGGIHSLDDVRALSEVADEGIIGAITGRAIYEGSLDFREGQELADRIAAEQNPGAGG